MTKHRSAITEPNPIEGDSNLIEESNPETNDDVIEPDPIEGDRKLRAIIKE